MIDIKSIAPANALREQIIKTVQAYGHADLGVGRAGNLSARVYQGFLITPSNRDYVTLKSADIVLLDQHGTLIGEQQKPSSEWRLHQLIYAERATTMSIVHTHSPYASAISCTRQDIPAFHYMVASAGGDSIRCAEYATFGSEALAQYALSALQDRQACLLANHGVIALGDSIAQAFQLAIEVESLAKQYYLSMNIGSPHILTTGNMRHVLEKFPSYKEKQQEQS